jgi:uncharacterized protein
MKTVRHALLPAAPGLQLELVSLHYGPYGPGVRKATLQASLHADEVPGMLVAFHLRRLLGELEDAGRLQGEVVLVPAANPLGLNQRLLHGAVGRFDLASGENFNRNYANLLEPVAHAVAGKLGPHAEHNVAVVRAALRDAIAALPAATPLESLRRTLLGLAADADVVLDLHCDGEALLHFYTATPLWPQAELLAGCIGAELVLLAERSGGDPFDEACSMLWPDLAQKLGPAFPLPAACLAATIELRGEADVAHRHAERDARGIVAYLAARGFVKPGPDGSLPAPVAELPCEALPLSGSIPVVAPHGGVLVFAAEPGAQLQQGDLVAELIDPLSGEVTRLTSPVDGRMFARDNRRFAVAGMPVAKVAGREALRRGKLLSA